MSIHDIPMGGRIAQFVDKGQIDASFRIDETTKRGGGNRLDGKGIFDSQCVACHGPQGRAMNFSDAPAKPQYLGNIATCSPW